MASFLVLVAFAFLAVVRAENSCPGGVITSPKLITSDVVVPPDASCLINSVNVTGSVILGKGSSLTTIGSVRIFGTILGNHCGSLFLTGKLAVSGGVSATKCNQVDVGPNANVGSLATMDVDGVLLQGTVALLSIGGSGSLTVSGGKVLGGGISRQNAIGSTTLCKATVLGGIKLEGVTGNFNAAASGTCGASDVSGTVEIVKSKMNVNFGGGMSLGVDLIANDIDGKINVFNTKLSDVSVLNVTGGLTLDGVTADSDLGVSMVKGNVKVTKSSFDGDASFSGNPGGVTIINNDFTLEDLIINNNGFVSIRNNANFSFAVSENAGVLVSDNKQITTASVSKNTGGVQILRNSFNSLSCVDNVPAPVGEGNSVIFGTGQCANF